MLQNAASAQPEIPDSTATYMSSIAPPSAACDKSYHSDTTASSPKPFVIKALNNELFNVNDALSILCSVADSFDSDDGMKVNNIREPTPHVTSVEEAFSQCDLVTLHLLPSSAAVDHLLTLFFAKLEPFYPFIRPVFPDPLDLANNRHVLMSIICAVASSYSPSAYLRGLEPALRKRAHSLIENAIDTACFSSSGTFTPKLVCEVILSVLLLLEWPCETAIDGTPVTLGLYNQVSLIRLATIGKLAELSNALSSNKHIFIALNMLDQVIAARLGVKTELRHASLTPNQSQNLNLFEKARIRAIELLALASRTLFSSREATRTIVADGSFLSMLKLIHPQFEQWLHDFGDVLLTADSWEGRSVLFEFNHCRLYVYSLVTAMRLPDVDSLESTHIDSDKLDSFKHFLKIAVDAASYVIDFETESSNPVGLDFGPPMRWIVRFIHASVFLAKTFLSSNTAWCPELRQQMFDKVSVAAKAMDAAGPQNFQLMKQYTQILQRVKEQINYDLLDKDEAKLDPAVYHRSQQYPPDLNYEDLDLNFYPIYEPTEAEFPLSDLDRTLLYMFASPEETP